jgi:hypothetical protein
VRHGIPPWAGLEAALLLPDFDDQQFALDLLEHKHVLVAPGTSFNVPYCNHFRITNLPEPQMIADVFGRMEELLHGDTRWLAGPTAAVSGTLSVTGGITSEEEEEQLEAINDWMEEMGLSRGMLAYDFADAATGEQRAVFDLAWPSGIQEELSQPVAVLLNESADTIGIASQAGYRCFTSSEEFRRYVSNEILVGGSGT